MEYRKLGRTGLKVSAFCLGTMTFRWTSSEEESYRVLERAWEAGITFIDTADIYTTWAPSAGGGVSEEIIGKWLKGKPREQVVLATKCRGRMWEGANGEGASRQHIMLAVEGSLRRLQTDVIDLYQIHSPDWDTPLDETMRALDDLVRQGKVRYIGCSNFQAWYLMKANAIAERSGYTRFDSVQPHFHLLNRREIEPETALLCLEEGIGMIPYSPLASGFLTGKYSRENPTTGSRGGVQRYFNEDGFKVIDTLREIGSRRGKTVAQMALAWQLSLPFITAPIVGANTVEQLNESLGAVGERLNEEEMTLLDTVTGVNRDYKARR
ncbi:MAG TPA: aldo/keto reductase [Aggregatilineales bacterium]|nr:aldo/keto reductase [Anaerolineales bacterium]HRE49295.1 aldo/keto reductase [Aggregatilineales bacterium]